MTSEWIHDSVVLIGTVLTAVSALYACLAAWAAARQRGAVRDVARPLPGPISPVSVLKPLCGDEPGLYENLRSFCAQSHPHFQLLFGLRDGSDPAGAVVRRLQAEFPQADIGLVVDARVHGANQKVSTLINLLPHARHNWLVLADSDIRAEPDHLERVTAPLADPEVGIVTCLYRGAPRLGGWARLGAQFIDEWFVPAVGVAHRFGSTRFAFGSTIAVRRDTLAAAGGFEALADLVADDFWLGEIIRRRGLRTVLSEVVVVTDVTDGTLSELWAHELRWMRTIRSVAPAGFALLFVTFTIPMLAAGLALARTLLCAALAATGVVARLLLHLSSARRRPEGVSAGGILRIPGRDLLLLVEWAAAYGGSRVRWRDQILHLGAESRARGGYAPR